MRIPQDTEALLCCLDMSSDEVTLARLKRLPGLDWTRIVRQAARRGLAPLLYERLRPLSSGLAIPDAALRTLRRMYLGSAARNAFTYHQLWALLRTLHEGRIQVALLKGAHLAKLVYGNIALRPMADLDLLVRRTDMEEAGRALLAAGYKPHPHNPWYQKTGHHHLAYVPRAEGVNVELHWDIRRWPAAENGHADGLWHRAEPLCIDGIDALGLSAEDLLLHVCLHTCSQHILSNGLVGLCDICQIARCYGGELQWNEVERRARHWAARKPIYLALRLARELLGAPVPEETIGTLEHDDLDAQVVAWAKDVVLADTMSMPFGLPKLWRAKRLRDKAIVLLRAGFPSREAMAAARAMRPDSPWIYPCYLVRVASLLRRYPVELWRLLWRGKAVGALLENRNAVEDWLKGPQ